MNFVNPEGPLGEYFEELEEFVEKTLPFSPMDSIPMTQVSNVLTVFENEIQTQTLLAKGFQHKVKHTRRYFYLKEFLLLFVFGFNWIIGLVSLLLSTNLQIWAFNFRLKGEFFQWKRQTRKLQTLIQKSIRVIKESEIVGRGFRLSPQLIAIEHLQQQLQYQTSIELRRVLLYSIKELLVASTRIEFQNSDYSKILVDRLGSEHGSSEVPPDPLSLGYLKSLEKELIQSRIILLYIWNMNYKMPDISLKRASIQHLQTLTRFTASFVEALEVVLDTQSNLLDPVKLELEPVDPMRGIYVKIHELYHKASLYKEQPMDPGEFLEFIHMQSLALAELTRLDTEPVTRSPVEKKSFNSNNAMDVTEKNVIDVDWNPVVELNSLEYELGDEYSMGDEGLGVGLCMDEFTKELVNVLRKRKQDRV